MQFHSSTLFYLCNYKNMNLITIIVLNYDGDGMIPVGLDELLSLFAGITVVL